MEDFALFLAALISIVIFVYIGLWDLKKNGCAFGGAADGHNYDGPDNVVNQKYID